MVKILLADQSYSSLSPTGYLILFELQEMGHTVVPVSTGFLPKGVQADDYIWRAWLEDNHTKLTWLANMISFDLFFSIRGDQVSPTTVNAMRARGMKALNWDFEEPFPDLKRDSRSELLTPTYWEKTRCYHMIFGIQATIRPWMPFAVYGKMFSPKQDNVRDVDIGFVGSVENPIRKEWIEKFKDLKIETRSGLSWSEVADFYSRCKIVVNKHQTSTINGRNFEATASGALLLTDYVPNLELCFEADREVAIYKGDGVEEAKHYLSHLDELDKIAKAGFERTLKSHRLKDRLSRMVSVVMGADNKLMCDRRMYGLESEKWAVNLL